MHKILLLIFFLQFNLSFYPSLSLAQTPTEVEKCQTGYTYQGPPLNRCIINEKVQESRTELTKCKNITDEVQREKCLLEHAESMDSKHGSASMDKWAKGLTISNQIAQAAFNLSVLKHYNKDGCQAKSWALMNFAAITSSAGELYSYWLIYKPRMKKMYEEFEDFAKEEQISVAQKRAFEFFAEEQEIKESTDRTRAIFYTTSSALYAIAAVVAGIELIKNKNPGTFDPNTICATSDGGIKKFVNSPLFAQLGIASGLLNLTTLIKKPKSIHQAKNLGTGANSSSAIGAPNPTPTRTPVPVNPRHNDPVESSKDGEGSQVFYDLKLYQAELNEMEKIVQNVSVDNGLKKLAINSIKELQKLFSTAIPEANAQITPFDEAIKKSLAELQARIAKQQQELAKKVEGNRNKKESKSRMIASIVMTAMGATVSTFAYKQANAHKKRADNFRDIAEKFPSDDSQLTICTDADRKDPLKPSCFCYQEDASGVSRLNDAHKGHEVCKGKVAQKWKDGNYDQVSNNQKKVCFNQSGAMDVNCQCKNQKNAQGQNSCMKAPQGIEVGNNLSFNALAGKVFGAAGALHSGEMEKANLDSSTLGGLNQAVSNTKKLVNDALVNAKEAPINFAKEEMELLKNTANEAKGLLPSSGGGMPLTGPGSASIASTLDDKQIEKLEKAAKEKGIEVSNIKFDSVSPTSSTTSGQNFDLGDLNGISDETEVLDIGNQDLMAKNFNYNNNDISNRSEENLFKMISNRYIMTGLKRLFDHEEKTNDQDHQKPDTVQ